MKAVCHIGMPKAGSTTIQEFLRMNASALEARGFLYRRFRPREVLQSEYMLVGLRATGRLLNDPLRRKRYGTRSVSELEAQVAGFETWFAAQTAGATAHTWLVSSEMLSATLHAREEVAAVHDWLSARFDEVTYVLYLRRQDLWLASRYSETLRNGSTATFDAYLKSAKGRDYLKLVDLWASVAGEDRLRLRLLEAGALKDGDLITDYCDAAGIDPSGLARPPRLNESFTGRGAAFVRKANAVVGRVLPKQTTTSRVIRKLARLLAQGLYRSDEKLSLAPRQRARVMAEFAASNEALRQRYFPERTTLFAEPEPAKARAPRRRKHGKQTNLS